MLDVHGTRLMLTPIPDGTFLLAAHDLAHDHAQGHVVLTGTQLADLAHALHHRRALTLHGLTGGSVTVYGWPGMYVHPVGAAGGVALSTAGHEHALWKGLIRHVQTGTVAS